MKFGLIWLGKKARAAALPLALVAAWQLLSLDPDRNYIFVPLTSVAESFVRVVASGELLLHLTSSLRKASLALVAGSIAGLSVGTGLASSTFLDRAFGPFLHAVRQVPVLGLAPLIGLWLGAGELAKVSLVFLSVFYPVLLNTYAGVKSIDVKLLEVSRLYGLNRRQTFRRVMLPALTPFLLTGLSHAIAFAWIATVGSEMLLTAGLGIGNMMQHAQVGGHMDVVLVCVICVGFTSMTIDRLVRRIGVRTTRWQDTAEARA